jgi:hypothetical protein
VKVNDLGYEVMTEILHLGAGLFYTQTVKVLWTNIITLLQFEFYITFNTNISSYYGD